MSAVPPVSVRDDEDPRRRRRRFFAAVAVLLAVGVVAASRTDGPTRQGAGGSSRDAVLMPHVGRALAAGRSRPVADLAEDLPLRARTPAKVVRPIAAAPQLQAAAPGTIEDDALQQIPPFGNMPPPGASFDGLSSQDVADAFAGNRVSPPNTNGDVGPNHYVQAVDVLVRIYQKNGAPSSAKPAPFKLSQLFAAISFPGVCATRDDGNTTVLYDQLADRWVLTETAFSSSLTPPYHQCTAVSQTPDPAGAYFLYDFALPSAYDSPRFGAWSDGYYMAANELTSSAAFAGVGVVAFDRNKMLAGNATAGFIAFHLGTYFTVGAGVSGMLPADLDGPTQPPAGTPSYFAALGPRMNYVATGGPTDTIRLFAFHADFINTATSTFIELPESPRAVATFDARENRIEQPAPATPGQFLDALQDRLMGRLAYRNFGGARESLVVAHTVNVGPDPTAAAGHQAALRYYEFRRSLPGDVFTVSEQATFAPDTANRWMGSAAMDTRGNLAVGYSVSSSTTSPSIRYAGRLAADPPNGLQQGEATLVDGSGVQLDTSGTWGATSSLVVDPVGDCTFWYTTQYYTLASQASSSAGWLTRIGSFKFPSCEISPAITTQPTSQTVGDGGSTSFTVAATGAPPLTYQWQVSTTGGASWTDLTNSALYNGVTTATLGITGATAALSGNLYRVVVTNAVGTATSTAATLTVASPPLIVTQPTSQTVAAGGNVSFTVAASGSPTPTYQWQLSTDGALTFTNLAAAGPYSGVTTPTLTITGAAEALTGMRYRVLLANSQGAATSNTVTLTVTWVPVFTTQPASQTVAAGVNTTFTAFASASPGAAYQWQISTNGGASFAPLSNGSPYSGATTTTLTITNVSAGLGGALYRAVATNSRGSTTSNAATLTVVTGGCVDADADRLCDSNETNTGLFVSPTNTGTNPANPDTDGDGLRDGDEVLGTLAGLNLPSMGVSPLKKNILLEYDWFDDNAEPGTCTSHSHRPTQAMLDRVNAMFAAAPVSNPDGTSGITAIHDFGQGGAFTGGTLVADADGILTSGIGNFEYLTTKAAHFAPSRQSYFHYVLMPHRYNTNSSSSGQAELFGNDMIVSLQCFTTTNNVANTIAHELGHNLGLHHGGVESCNWKPNYNSVMNYRFQFPGIDLSGNAIGSSGEANVLDFSHGTRPALNENALNENLGVTGTTPAIDWNFNGTIESVIGFDLNRTSANPNASTPVDNAGCAATLTTLNDFNDWGAIFFAGVSQPSIASAPVRQVVICDNPNLPMIVPDEIRP